MAEDAIDEESGVSIALTPVELYAMLNGKSISQSELASNTWHEMPVPTGLGIERFLATLPEPADPRQAAWNRQSHYSQPTPPDCWRPPPVRPLDPTVANRESAVLQIIGGAVETIGGALLILAPDPTLLTKVGGSALALHGLDTTQAAMRQLFSGKPVEDFTQMGATWAAREAGASEQSAHRIGVILDVGVPFTVGAGIFGAERVMAIRAGRVILSEEAVAGKVGRVSLDVEEADSATGKEGGHALERHVNVTSDDIKARALGMRRADAVASRFFNKKLAEDAVNDAIRANRASIQRWAANAAAGKPNQAFEFVCNSEIGEGFLKATGQFQRFSKVRIVFKPAQSSGKLFYIVTAFPVP